MKLTPDGKIGPYRLIENLGVVPRGKAYRAVDERIDRLVILKTIPRSVIERVPGPEVGLSWSEAIAEAKRLTRMDRQGIVSLYEIVEDDDGLALSFAPSEGRTLRTYLADRAGSDRTGADRAGADRGGADRGGEGSGVDRATLIEWTATLLDLLAEAHGQEVLHRHLGEDSVRIDEAGRVQLTGFGLTQLEFDRSRTEAPELGTGGEATPASDLYQAGSLMLRLAEGSLDPGDPLLAVLEKAAHGDPDERYLDAGDMQIALRNATAERLRDVGAAPRAEAEQLFEPETVPAPESIPESEPIHQIEQEVQLETAPVSATPLPATLIPVAPPHEEPNAAASTVPEVAPPAARPPAKPAIMDSDHELGTRLIPSSDMLASFPSAPETAQEPEPHTSGRSRRPTRHPTTAPAAPPTRASTGAPSSALPKPGRGPLPAAIAVAALLLGGGALAWWLSTSPLRSDSALDVIESDASQRTAEGTAESTAELATPRQRTSDPSSKPTSHAASPRRITSEQELPDNPPEVLRELTRARDLILEGDDEGAGYLLEELMAVPSLPNPLPVLDALGSLYLRTGRPRRAQATIEQALAILPNTERHYQLGLARAAQGDTEGALDALHAALALDPGSENVRTVIAYLEVGR